MIDKALEDSIKEQFASPDLQACGAILLRWLEDLAEGGAENDKESIANRADLVFGAFELKTTSAT